jgi:hypothetical protein
LRECPNNSTLKGFRRRPVERIVTLVGDEINFMKVYWRRFWQLNQDRYNERASLRMPHKGLFHYIVAQLGEVTSNLGTLSARSGRSRLQHALGGREDRCRSLEWDCFGYHMIISST